MDAESIQELMGICQEIEARAWTIESWQEHESDDEFQTTHFCGGFDADEGEFCFSFFSGSVESWFQISLDEVGDIARGQLTEIEKKLSKR